jgi:hypothetical protein
LRPWRRTLPAAKPASGEMAEWLKAHAWKVSVHLVTKNDNLR